MTKKVISTSDAPAAIGTYSQAIKVQGTVYLSGQTPIVPATGKLVTGGFEREVRQVFANLGAVANAAGGSLNDVVKFNVYLIDLGNFSVVNAVMTEVLRAPFPARATVQVSALPMGAQVEVDAVMVLAD